MLTKAQITRYGRQLTLREVGIRGQQQLLDSSVLVIGAGGLGSPAAWYLAAAGVGTIGIVDSESVELSNLHRQIVHTTDAVGMPKPESARVRLAALNPEVRIVGISERLEAGNAPRILEGYDLILDGSDNLATRYLVNDACVALEKPLIYGGVVGFHGQLLVILPGRSACFRCVFPDVPQPGEIPSCEEAGVLGSVAGVIGTLMAQEALKHLAGIGQGLTDRLVSFDGLAGRFREVPVRRDRGCAVCGDHRLIHPVLRGSPLTLRCQGARGEIVVNPKGISEGHGCEAVVRGSRGTAGSGLVSGTDESREARPAGWSPDRANERSRVEEERWRRSK